MAQITLNSSGVASSGSLLLQTNGTTTQATVDTSGNLGLGVTPSAWASSFRALDMYGTGSVASASDNMNMTNNAYFNGTNYIYKANGAANRYAQSGGIHYWFTAASGTAGNAISFTQAMTLDASGNLLVNTTSAAAGKLAVKSSDANTLWLIGRASDGTSSVSFRNNADSAYNARIECFDTGVMTFGTGTSATERARIDSSGNLLVGTTSQQGAAPARIDVLYNGASAYGSNFKTSHTSGIPCNFLNSSGTRVGYISTDSSSTAYNTSSDYRLKENIEPMTGALAKVAALKPVTYKWKADSSDGEGFIAHELAEVVPQCVTGEKDAIDENGNPVYQGIDTSFLVATLTAAIQELKAEFDAYKATHP